MQRPPAAEVESSRTLFQVTPLPQLLTIPSFFNERQATFLTNLFHGLKKPAATLRPHQISALNEYCQGLMQGSLHAVVSMVMGSGKTVLAAHLILNGLCGLDGKPSGRVLITTSKINLVAQIKNEIETHCGEQLKVVLFDANKSDWRNAHVIVATDAALKIPFNRALLLSEVQMVIMDEAHKSLGEAGVAMARDFMQAGCLVLPMTATPSNDMKNLDEKENGVKSCYELIGVTPDTNSVKPFGLIAAVEMGMLAPVSSGIIEPDLDAVTRAQLENQREEMQEEKLGRLINQPALNNLAVDIYANGTDPNTKTRFFGKQAIVFCGGVNHAEDMAYAFNQHLPVDHERIRQARDLYLRNAQRRAIENRQPFDRQAASAAFKVAQAIHAGEYKVSIAYEKIAAALETNCIEFLNPRTGRVETYNLTTRDREQLLTKQSLNKSGHLAVLDKLNKAEKKAILEKIEDGGILVVTGADMLIEGANYPDVSLLIAPRGTASLTLEAQRSGRVLRKRAGKRACIIEFDLNLPKQVFFFDLTAGKMALGTQDQPQLPPQEDFELIPIPNVAKSSGLDWSEAVVRRIKFKSLRPRLFPSIVESEHPASAKEVDEMAARMLTVLAELSHQLNELEVHHAGLTASFDRSDETEVEDPLQQDDDTELQPVRLKRRQNPPAATPTSTEQQGFLAEQAVIFIQMREQGAKLIKRLEKLQAVFNALVEEEELPSNAVQKRRRMQGVREQTITLRQAAQKSELIILKEALTTMKDLRQQMINLLQEEKLQPNRHEPAHAREALPEAKAQRTENFPDLLQRFSAVLTSLEDAKQALSVEKLPHLLITPDRQNKAELRQASLQESSSAEVIDGQTEIEPITPVQDVEMIPAAASISLPIAAVKSADTLELHAVQSALDPLVGQGDVAMLDDNSSFSLLSPPALDDLIASEILMGGEKSSQIPALLDRRYPILQPGRAESIFAGEVNGINIVPALKELNSEQMENFRDELGNTYLHLAVKYKRLGAVKFLVDKLLCVDLENADGDTPLHLAAKANLLKKDCELLTSLLERLADPFKKNKTGETPLMLLMMNISGFGKPKNNFSVEKQKYYMVFLKLFLKELSPMHHNKLNEQDNVGNTALHYIAAGNKLALPFVEWLCDYGARIDVKNLQNKTPIDFSQDNTIRDSLQRRLKLIRYNPSGLAHLLTQSSLWAKPGGVVVESGQPTPAASLTK